MARKSKAGRVPDTAPSSVNATAELGLIDTAYDYSLRNYIAKFEDGFPAALNDAIEFCGEHQLWERDDLTAELKELVQTVRTYADQPPKQSRRRKPQRNHTGMSPTRVTKGRAAYPPVHLKRFEKLEAYLEEEARKGLFPSLNKASRVVGGDEHDAYRKSYQKVEFGDLFAAYYEPDYVDPSKKSK